MAAYSRRAQCPNSDCLPFNYYDVLFIAIIVDLDVLALSRILVEIVEQSKFFLDLNV
jgi:hypothetical protein